MLERFEPTGSEVTGKYLHGTKPSNTHSTFC